LERRSSTVLLRQLEAHKLRHKADSDYQVWQEGNHPEQIRTEATMWQKLEYTTIRWCVDTSTLHWRYSSARNYAGSPGLIDVVTDWR
jgi:putative transposase